MCLFATLVREEKHEEMGEGYMNNLSNEEYKEKIVEAISDIESNEFLRFIYSFIISARNIDTSISQQSKLYVKFSWESP